MLEILGERYEEVRGADAALWRGDLMLLDDAAGEDCRAYMFCMSEQGDRLELINYVGYKAGSRLATKIPRAASSKGALNIRLTWLQANWERYIPVGSYEMARFYRWISTSEQ